MLNQPKRPLPPSSIIGIIGGGQLGRMAAIAAANLGYHVHIFTPEANSPASEVAQYTTIAEYNDLTALEKFAQAVDVISFEFENIPHTSLQHLAKFAPVHPSPAILELSQNRLREKDFLNSIAIETAPYARVTNAQELADAVEKIGKNAILKTSEFGYDGKGQIKITTESNLELAWQELATNEAVLEGFVNFTKEISVIIARNQSGEIALYPAVENIHKNHILHQTIAPANITAEINKSALAIAEKIAEKIQIIGLLAVEMFLNLDGKIIVNELAPRPHNSGHWSIDAGTTSQFEQQIRAISNLPLGGTKILFPSIMTNLIGEDVNNWQTYLQNPSSKLHLYGKKTALAGRKMGHVTSPQ